MGELRTENVTEADVWRALENVKDPEIPVLSAVDLGIITRFSISSPKSETSRLTCWFIPTFVGCPALDVIKKNIEAELKKLPFEKVEVMLDNETAWSSNRISAEGKKKLEAFGLAPPAEIETDLDEATLNKIRCPYCQSTDTTLRSPFGSTLCRAIRFCYNCKQGFEQFKPL